jgi:beta-phosphoglucomutase family hydrolase
MNDHRTEPSLGPPLAVPDDVEGLIFDCDGTLADTMPVHFRAWNTMLAGHGITFPERQFYDLAGMPSASIIRLLAAEQSVAIDEAAIPTMVDDKEDRYVDLIDEVVPLAAVLAVAEAHRGRLPMAVASGGQHRVIAKTLTAIGALQWFDAIVGYEDTERHKPDPDVFLEAASRLGVAPARCLVFEDADLGIEAARRAGMRWVDVRTWASTG